MMNLFRQIIPFCLLLLFLLSIDTTHCDAGGNRDARGKRGFNWGIESEANNLELNDDQKHWAMEVVFKPMRLVKLQIKDPKTGKKKEQLVWYLVYKAVNRPLAITEHDKAVKPINTEDAPHSKPYFVPEFVLVSNDNDGSVVYKDQILSQAQKIILKRELRGSDAKRHFKDSVDVIATIPDTVEKGKENSSNIIYGIATWTDIDPEVDYFTVYMSGFSSGYKKGKGPGGKDLVLRRTIMQKFWRPGDEFDQDEIEFRRKGEVKWIYRPDPETK